MNILAQAVINLNRKIRRRGTISAFKIHTSRDLHTGENLHLDDKNLRNDQLKNRESNNVKTKVAEVEEILVGDTVIVHNRGEKHKAKDMFIVTGKVEEKVDVQKIIHPLQGKGKFMSKVYRTDQRRLKPIHRSTIKPSYDIPDEDDEVPNEEGNNLEPRVCQILPGGLL